MGFVNETPACQPPQSFVGQVFSNIMGFLGLAPTVSVAPPMGKDSAFYTGQMVASMVQSLHAIEAGRIQGITTPQQRDNMARNQVCEIVNAITLNNQGLTRTQADQLSIMAVAKAFLTLPKEYHVPQFHGGRFNNKASFAAAPDEVEETEEAALTNGGAPMSGPTFTMDGVTFSTYSYGVNGPGQASLPAAFGAWSGTAFNNFGPRANAFDPIDLNIDDGSAPPGAVASEGTSGPGGVSGAPGTDAP